MKKQYKIIVNLIKKYKNNEDCIDVGTKELAPTEDSIKRVEQVLKIKLPKSYLWFLKNYGYIIIFGEELFSISNKIEDIDLTTSDIEYNYFWYKNKSFIGNNEIPIFDDEFGKLYVMDTLKMDNYGEYPIYSRYNETGEEKVFYANNFLSFLEKQLKDCE